MAPAAKALAAEAAAADVPPKPQCSDNSKSASGPSVAIVGAGFSGICMGVQLIKAGYSNFTIYEAADDIGGTWRDNTYPGCSCDIPSVQYHLSFEPVQWEEPFVGQAKILQYLHHCVHKYKLQDHIKLNTKVSSAEFDADKAQWQITTAAGEESCAQMLILAQGGLAIPSIPKIPGLESFPGTAFHSAQWNHSCDLTGKRVAIVGTGASAVQIIPSIQPLVEKLYVFQRTPGWVISRKDFIQRSRHMSMALTAVGLSTAAAAAAAGAGLVRGRKAAAVAAATVAAAGTAAMIGSGRVWLWVQRQVSFLQNELLLGPAVTRNDPGRIAQLTKFALDNLNKSVSDPELRAKLTPTYTLGCKRVLGSDRYYPALQQDNVELMTSAVTKVSADGTITAADGSTATGVDTIILATGFDVAASLQFKTLSVNGLDGQDLGKTLAEDPYGTYLGLAVSGFPNMFLLMGPNTWLGHNSVLFMIECGVSFIMKFIKKMKNSTGRWYEVDQSAQQRFSREAQARLQGSVWLSGGCSSWYLPKEDAPASKVIEESAGNGDDVATADQDTGVTQSDVTANPKPLGPKPALKADSHQQSCVMWVGTCLEYWWRTLWPRVGDWQSVL